jgi:hypothetical protein
MTTGVFISSDQNGVLNSIQKKIWHPASSSHTLTTRTAPYIPPDTRREKYYAPPFRYFSTPSIAAEN